MTVASPPLVVTTKMSSDIAMYRLGMPLLLVGNYCYNVNSGRAGTEILFVAFLVPNTVPGAYLGLNKYFLK